MENKFYWYFFNCYCTHHLIYGCPCLQCFGGGVAGYVVGGGGVVGCVVASLQPPSMLPLSSQIIGSFALGPGMQPTGILHSALVWFSVNC
jgi:hypothetical protein